MPLIEYIIYRGITHIFTLLYIMAEKAVGYVLLPSKIIEGNRHTIQVPWPRPSQYITFIVYN